MKLYRIVKMVDGKLAPINLTSKNDLKKWARMAGHEVSGFVKNTTMRAELQDEPILKGLIGPMYDGKSQEGYPVVRYEDDDTYERLSA